MTRPRTLEYTPFEPFERYAMEISFDGGCYAGWQIQPHCETVQEVLQRTLAKLFDVEKIHVLGASRTDSGVHSLGFIASFLVPERPVIPPEKLIVILNRILPKAIRINSIDRVPLTFHARYDATGKAYTYIFNRGEETPFANRYSWKLRHELDFEAMLEAAQYLVGEHDFSSFVVERREIDSAVRTIYSISKQEFGNYVCFTFKGNGFLYKMIRCIVGTLEAVGSGKIQLADVPILLEAKQREIAPETAPAHGLFLMKTFFDEREIEPYTIENVPFFR